MIDAILSIEDAITGYAQEEQEAIQQINKVIYEYFLSHKVQLPVIPQVGMRIDLGQFYDKLDDTIKEWIDDNNSHHKIKDVIICKDYLEICLA
ncbi:hypothetical protein AHMF7605_05670 [Adhaeribacter arboris]|uniref:Uncharacterized protein n=1 Tax=Adhaeribacter arboris TaxID=2072846 RepID=A0A2T2YC15_9BACT|nr:hypothetical protein [Adhaeribacter arboris]PSR53049.1 hypothetical protein AHMF7605_05670 [Adhaeribacter arboris]